MLTGEQLHAVWFLSYRKIVPGDVNSWVGEIPAQRAAWDALAKWLQESAKHKASCPVRQGQEECSC